MIISNATLDQIQEAGITVPSYDRNSLRPTCAHIGLGHFHRAHFLTYMDKLLGAGLWHGGVFELDIVPADPIFIEGLKKQDYLYSVLSLASDGSRELRINGPIVGYANQGTDPERVHAVLSSDETKLVTLTITEKGYCYHDEKGSLDWENPAIIHDLEGKEAPRSAIGCIAKALKARFEANSPLTIMSCDNVPENGKILRLSVLQFCQKKYPEIVSWVKGEIAFPCTMVDRITPGTSSADIEQLEKEYGLIDHCAVHCEDFSQWVIEDSASTTIPDFSKVDALVVDDVKPYELMKIRLLNGAHSALSYPAYMMGIAMVHEAVTEPLIRTFIRELYMEHITGTLDPVSGVDLDAYKDKAISRFSNPHIADTILRLASDGSKKISNAILRPLEEGLEAGKSVDALIMALALWQYYYVFRDAEGTLMPIDDPKKDQLLSAAGDAKRFLAIAGLAEGISGNEELFSKMSLYRSMLESSGVRKTIEDFIAMELLL